MKLNLYVENENKKIPVIVSPALKTDLAQTKNWQTFWLSKDAVGFPNKVALKRRDNGELLGLMSYSIDESVLAVEIVYIESAAHSNANMLNHSEQKKYLGVAKALFAYAVQKSLEAGFGGVIILKAKTTKLMEYYIREFGARPAGRYNPFQLIIWNDAAEAIISSFIEGE